MFICCISVDVNQCLYMDEFIYRLDGMPNSTCIVDQIKTLTLIAEF